MAVTRHRRRGWTHGFSQSKLHLVRGFPIATLHYRRVNGVFPEMMSTPLKWWLQHHRVFFVQFSGRFSIVQKTDRSGRGFPWISCMGDPHFTNWSCFMGKTPWERTSQVIPEMGVVRFLLLLSDNYKSTQWWCFPREAFCYPTPDLGSSNQLGSWSKLKHVHSMWSRTKCGMWFWCDLNLSQQRFCDSVLGHWQWLWLRGSDHPCTLIVIPYAYVHAWFVL